MRGSTARGMPHSASRSSSQSSERTSMSIVREALETSVTWTSPRVRRATSQLSTVPKASSPRSARSRAPGTCSSSQASLLALK
jgi:hypothetical protein